MKKTFQIAIVTLGDDLHGVTIQRELEKYDDIKCHIIESDRMCGNRSITWSNVLDVSFCKMI
jgi:hypothetical protein